MKKFVVCIEGAGEGCDYTIGCNKRFYETEAESIDDLLLEFHEEHDGENYLKRRNDFAYENVYVIEGGLINVTDKLQAMIDKDYAELQKKEAAKIEADELKLYKSLKRKYEK